MCHKFEILDGAFFISDAHHSHNKPELKQLLQDILHAKLTPPQLILMGDIFDTLFGIIDYTIKQNEKIIDILNDIAIKIEVIYLEGNHDFCLDGVFKNIKIYPLKLQPLFCTYHNKVVCLAHGDFIEGIKYKFYTSLIRSHIMLLILKYIDILGNHFILKKLDNYLKQKDNCQNFKNFKKYITHRLENKYAQKCNIFIEGHFHQDTKFKIKKMLYINLPAFACNQRYFIVKSSLLNGE